MEKFRGWEAAWDYNVGEKKEIKKKKSWNPSLQQQLFAELTAIPHPSPHPHPHPHHRSSSTNLRLAEVSFFVCFIYLFIYLLTYLLMAVLGLRFCASAFSSCGKWGPLFIAVRGPLTIAASLVAEHRLQTRRLSSCGSRA